MAEQSHGLDELEALDSYARLEERGFLLYERQYKRQYPPPANPVHWYTGIPWLSLPMALIALCGALLAALRTAPVFVEIAKLTVEPTMALVEGVLAMMVVDAGVIMFRYASVYLSHRDKENTPTITRWVQRGAVFAFVTQLIAQVYAVRGMVSWMPEEVDDFLQLAIAAAAALSGMVLAYVTGEILAVLVLQMQHERRKRRAMYLEQVGEWRDGLVRAWRVDRVKYIGRPPHDVKRRFADTRTPDADTDADTDSAHDTQLSPSEQKVIAFLMENPDKASLSVRQLSDLIGVNRDAVSKARRRVVSDNGYGRPRP